MQENKVVKRWEQAVENTWNMEDMYANEELWEADGKWLEEELTRFAGFKGRLAEGSAILLEAMQAYEEISRRHERYYVYANQKLHENTGDSKYQKLCGQSQVMSVKLGEATAFLVPEILSIPEETLAAYRSQEPGLAPSWRMIGEILRQKAHTLDAKGEELLARVDELGQAPSNIYSMFNNADITFEPLEGKNGEKLPLTQGRYVSYLEQPDRELRKQAFTHLYASYGALGNTIAAMFDANVRKAVFFARERKYASSREAALDNSSIPVRVYDQLIEAVHDHLPDMYRYVSLRRHILGVDELHMYDVYVPIVKAVDKQYTFEEAKALVLEGLAPLGEDYAAILREGFDNRWIDVYENEGKRTGAYSWGAYGVHPYVLMNYQGTLNHVFTLAHEMGHALHSYYSDHSQGVLDAGYHIFVAEVASTCNETLLIHYLLEKAEDREERKYLINYFLDQFKGTLYRQTMFAEFEKIVHSMVESGETLTADVLCERYRELNGLYFGPDMVNDPEIAWEWARIPHFYTPFYVYQYATGFSAAIAIASRILKEGAPAVEDYKKFLRGGCSMTPIELLKLCGVDMTEKAPVEAALSVFASYVEELEKLCD